MSTHSAFYHHFKHFFFVIAELVFVSRCRYVGFSRPGPDAAEVSVCADGPRDWEGGSEAQVEVAADAAEQRGQWYISLGRLRDWWLYSTVGVKLLWTFLSGVGSHVMNEEVHTMDKVKAFSCLAACSFQTFKMSNAVDKCPPPLLSPGVNHS